MTLDELERLERKATPAPWKDETEPRISKRGTDWRIISTGDVGPVVARVGPATNEDVWRDAALIATMRNAMPALLRAVRAASELQALKDTRPPDYETRKPQAWAELRAALAALEEAE